MDITIRFRSTSEDRARYEARAKAAGKTLSGWIRWRCDSLLPSELPVKEVIRDIPTYPPGKPIEPDPYLEGIMKRAEPLTRAEREAKNLAFQKQTGMSGGKKK